MEPGSPTSRTELPDVHIESIWLRSFWALVELPINGIQERESIFVMSSL